MPNRYVLLAVILFLAVIGITGYYYIASITGYSFEVYGTLDLNTWEINSCDTTHPQDDYSILPKSSSDDGITVLQTGEVIIVVQINEKTYEQNLGSFEMVTNQTMHPYYNVIITHIPKGTHEYTVFLYETTGLLMKSRILRDQIDGSITV